MAIFKVDDLDFGTVVISNTQGGTVTMPSNGNPRSFSGGAEGVPGDPGNRAQFTVVGNPGQEIILTHSVPLTLTNAAGDDILVINMWLNGSPLRTLSPVDGREQVYLGGTLSLAADQPEGLYEASFTVTVDYR
nr:DUF4402 domain-containing protein [Sphingomicrobium lutaoense]